MCAINVGFHLFRTQEGIVDIGVDGIRMVNIDHSRPKIVGIINELITVIETILPLLVGVDGAERGDQYIKIIVEPITSFDGTLSRIGIHTGRSSFWDNANTTFALVTPRGRHVQRLLMIEVRIQRTFIVVIIETQLQTGIHIASPDRILILFHIPFPIELFRTIATLFTQAHHVFGYTGCQMGTQSDIVDHTIGTGNQGDMVGHVTVRFQFTLQLHQKTIILIHGFPSNGSRFTLGNGEVQIFPGTTICLQTDRLV